MVCEAIVPHALRGFKRLKLVSSNMQSMSSFLLSVQDRKLLDDRKLSQSAAPMMEAVTPGSANTTFCCSSLATIIVALFFSILCALGINALLRCRLLCRQWRGVFEPSHDVGAERAQTSRKKFDLKALPVTLHYTGSPFTGMDCPICLADFMEGERVRILPECCHSFHADCIDAWLVSNASCPSCRHSLLPVLLKKPPRVAPPAESAQMDVHVTERNESVAANHILQSFHISGDNSTMTASSSLDSIRSSDHLESGNAVETRRP